MLEKPARTLAHRARNPELTRREILEAARAEFAERGLDGARVDRIAERADANKRLIYHYFNSKDELYSAVLEDVYRQIRVGEFGLDLEHKAPADAMRGLVRFTLDHGKDSRQILTQALDRAGISILDVTAASFPISAVH